MWPVYKIHYNIFFPCRIGDPLCDKAIPSCDSSSAFRTITGKCNNLNNPVWGETNTPFLREILVGDYDSGNFT